MAPLYNELDLKVFSKVGQAFWKDEDFCCKSSAETLAAASLMNLTPERTVDVAVSGLLERARLEGMANNGLKNRDSLGQPFFRLTPEERLVLVALHIGRWTYGRLSRILGMNIEEIQELAWSARLQLSLFGSYPAGPSVQRPSCPEYDFKKPWTQRFLDDEILSKRDFIFLQNHLMGCDSCRNALARCRDVYFKVESQITSQVGKVDFSKSFEKILSQGPYYSHRSQITFFESLKIFGRREEIRWVLVAFGFLVLLKLLK